MKKIIASVVALAAVAGLAFADVKVNFYNKLYSEDPFLVHEHNDNEDKWETNAYFPGIKERMYADIKTDKVDAGVKGTFKFFQNNETDHFGFSGAEINDWWVEFRPFDIITFGLHDDIWAEGSYFPIWDDNVSGGNIGSSGFTAVLRPLGDSLRIGATIPGSTISYFYNTVTDEVDEVEGENYLNGKTEDGEHDSFHFGLGAIYGIEQLEIGVAFQNIPCGDDRQLGGYVNLPGLFGAVEELTVGAGFTHAWGLTGLVGDVAGQGVAYENLLNAYATYEADSFGITAEVAFNLADDSVGTYDFYTAAAVSFGLADKLTATATGKFLFDLSSDSEDMALGAKFGVDYEVNEKNTIGAEFEFNKCGDYWAIAVPVYWKYTLEY